MQHKHIYTEIDFCVSSELVKNEKYTNADYIWFWDPQ